MLPRRHRLTRQADFARVFASARPQHQRFLSLRAASNDLEVSRFGVVCGKRVGGAVVRNRAKRRLRAALQQLTASVPPGWDILVVIQPPAANAAMGDFLDALKDLLRRYKLLEAQAER